MGVAAVTHIFRSMAEHRLHSRALELCPKFLELQSPCTQAWGRHGPKVLWSHSLFGISNPIHLKQKAHEAYEPSPVYGQDRWYWTFEEDQDVVP